MNEIENEIENEIQTVRTIKLSTVLSGVLLHKWKQDDFSWAYGDVTLSCIPWQALCRWVEEQEHNTGTLLLLRSLPEDVLIELDE